MADSLIIDFLDENKFRSYPMRTIGDRVTTSGVPLDLFILDANLVYTDDVLPDHIMLAELHFSTNGSNHDCSIKVTGQNDFNIQNVETSVYPLYIRNINGSLLVIGSDITSIGYTNQVFNGVEFEAAVCYHFNSQWQGVKSLTVNGNYLLGDIIWNEGYQFLLSPDDVNMVITMGARGDYGTPIGCHEFFPDIPKDCGEIISSINSVPTQNTNQQFNFIAGSNIAIFEDFANHTIFIGLNFSPSDICPVIKSSPTPTVI